MTLISSRAVRALSACLLVLLPVAGALSQLTPPAGPVAPSMKRLDQIEPRTCVSTLPGSATAVHVISSPGNYVLTQDVVGQDRKSGIVITCDGTVSLDLNGFSLVGVAGSLHGIHHIGGTGNPDSRRVLVIPHVLEVRGTIRSWGGHGLNLNSLDVCDIGGLQVEDCGGAACRVVSHDGSRNDIRYFKSRTCGGGIQLDMSSGSGGGAGGACKATVKDISVMRCSGDAVHVRFSSSAACDVSISDCVAVECSGHGAFVEAVDGAGGGGGGSACKVTVKDINVMRCTGSGVRCVCRPGWTGPSCELRRISVADVDGDGIHMFDVGVEFEDVFCSSCGGKGLHVEGSSAPVSRCVGSGFTFDTTIFACFVKNVGDVSLSNGRCASSSEDGFHLEDVALAYIGTCDASSCGNDGISVTRVAKFKAGAELAKSCRVTACGGNGVSIIDCPDASCSGLDVSLCIGGGLLHGWTSPPDVALIGHELVHVTQCGSGGGLRIECPSASMSLDVSCASSSFSSNTGAGVSISCPAACPVRCSFSHSSSNNNGGSGVELSCHPGSGVHCACSHLRCVGNGGGGVVVVSSDAAATLSSGSLSLDTCVCSSNSGGGCVCHCPVVGDRCVFSENGASGVDVRVASSFDSAGSLSNCTLHRNALHGARCGPGRYSGVACDASDNGGDGMRCESGCLIADRCLCNRNGGDGLHVSGTLTVSGGAMRRNGGGGVRCADGSCIMSDCVCELNGANPGVTGGGALFVDCSSVSISRCVCSSNTGPGVQCSSASGIACAFTAIECDCSSNSLDGMSLTQCSGGQVVRCVFSNNSVGWGLECLQGFVFGKIESCSCTGNGGGILVEGQNNLVISNTCSAGPIGAISVTQGNAVGRIVDQASLQTGACDGRSNLVH